MSDPSRRSVLAGAASLVAGALAPLKGFAQQYFPSPEEIYAPVTTEPFAVPGIDLRRLNQRFLRTVVSYQSNEQPGTIIINPEERFLYVVDSPTQAIRYGVGVGREGFGWSGVAHINAKREWPDWYPPAEMIARDPSIKAVMSQLPGGIGMHGGAGNPLGARAMYLYEGSKDTLYRIHGTLEPYSIGTRVSSGCLRMIHQDVLDLFSRIPVGTKVIVLGPNGRLQSASGDDEAGPVAREQYAQPRRSRVSRVSSSPAADPFVDPGRQGPVFDPYADQY